MILKYCEIQIRFDRAIEFSPSKSIEEIANFGTCILFIVSKFDEQFFFSIGLTLLFARSDYIIEIL